MTGVDICGLITLGVVIGVTCAFFVACIAALAYLAGRRG